MVASKTYAYADGLYALYQRCCPLDPLTIEIGSVRLSPSELDVMLLLAGELSGIDPISVETLAEMGLAEIAEKLGRIAAEGGEVRYGAGVCVEVERVKVGFLLRVIGVRCE